MTPRDGQLRNFVEFNHYTTTGGIVTHAKYTPTNAVFSKHTSAQPDDHSARRVAEEELLEEIQDYLDKRSA